MDRFLTGKGCGLDVREAIHAHINSPSYPQQTGSCQTHFVSCSSCCPFNSSKDNQNSSTTTPNNPMRVYRRRSYLFRFLFIIPLNEPLIGKNGMWVMHLEDICGASTDEVTWISGKRSQRKANGTTRFRRHLISYHLLIIISVRRQV